MENNIITKRIRKDLAKIAKGLPECFHKDIFERVKVGVVDKRTIRVQNQQKPVNHKKQLEVAYSKSGRLGVFEYCKGIQDIVDQSAAPEAEVKQTA